jgi:capsular exopolysaccharide synthesis family protein
MSGEITSLNKNVQAAQERLSAYQKKSGLIAIPAAGSSRPAMSGGMPSSGSPTVHSPILDRLMQLNQTLVEAETARISREAIYRVAQAGDVDALSNMAAEMNLGGSTDSSQSDLFSGLQTLRGQQTSLKLDLSSALRTYGAKNPHLKDTEQRLQIIDREIKAEVQRIRDRAKLDFNIAKKNEDEIRQAYNAVERKASNSNDAMMKLAILQQEADSSRFIYEDLYTKLQESKLSEGTQSSNVALINPALPSATPLHPKKILNTTIGFAVGLLFGIISAFIIESFDDAIITTVEVEQLTGVPVLGMIGKFNTSAARESNKRPVGAFPPSSDVGPDQLSLEAYLTLRTNLLLSQAGSPPRTLLLTSSLPGEGKTTTTYNLAAAFASMGKRVLVIDADLRKPAIHKYSHLPNAKGLSNLVTSSMNPSEAIQQSHINENLLLLTSGPLPPNPTELLGSTAFSELLVSLLQQFDFVLIDSPPTMLVADALIISQKVDAVVVIVRSGKTTRPVLLRVTESLQRHAGNFVGFVLNAVDSTSPEHYYTYGYSGKTYGKGYYDTDASNTSNG